MDTSPEAATAAAHGHAARHSPATRAASQRFHSADGGPEASAAPARLPSGIRQAFLSVDEGEGPAPAASSGGSRAGGAKRGVASQQQATVARRGRQTSGDSFCSAGSDAHYSRALSRQHSEEHCM
jgi:hypothetical protein